MGRKLGRRKREREMQNERQKDLKPIIQSIVELEGFICATTENVCTVYILYMLKLRAFI